MMTLIIGGSGSGKSAYAENRLEMSAFDRRKYYIATMQVFDKEGQAKVDRHKMLRKDKGFITIEQQLDIEKALDKMGDASGCALLECMSNLVANEMFSGTEPKSEAEVTVKILEGMTLLTNKLSQLVVVSNNVFEDGQVYDDTTMEYIRAMGKINEKLAQMADEVIEVVVGIPVEIKKNES